ncbi:MAG: lysostaphin resistance A-like protein [Acidimicrobiia bacterium]
MVYVLLAFALSWSWWIPMAGAGGIARPAQAWPNHLPGLLGPAIAALVTTAWFDGRTGLRRLGQRVARWRVGALPWIVVAATVFAAPIPVVLLSDVSHADLGRYSGAPSVGWFVVPYVVVLNGFGEEAGWRGFLVDRLVTRHGLRRAAVITWVVWLVWHVPLFWVTENFRDFGVAGTAGWAVSMFFGSAFLAWLYVAADRSILVLALWHAAYNFAVATEAAVGAVPALVSTAVVIAAVVVMRRDVKTAKMEPWHRPTPPRPTSTPI